MTRWECVICRFRRSYAERVTAARLARPVLGTFLDQLSDADQSDLFSFGQPRSFRRGASVVLQGDRSDAVFVLLRGRVKVSLNTVDGHEIVLAVLRPGDLVGEFEAIDMDGGPRTASNVALESVETWKLNGDRFRSFLESHPQVGLVLLRTIIHRLRTADQRRTDSRSEGTVGRLAKLLVELAEEHGQPTSTGVNIDIPLTQQELASLISVSRESVVRALRSLRSRGLVATGRRRITIHDSRGLADQVDNANGTPAERARGRPVVDGPV